MTMFGTIPQITKSWRLAGEPAQTSSRADSELGACLIGRREFSNRRH
jgi:hypothetical protein